MLWTRSRWLVAALLVGLLAPAAVRAQVDGIPVAGKKVSLGGEAGTKSAKFAFQSEKDQAPLLANPDPTAGFELLVQGQGAGAGESELVSLDPTLWKVLGKAASPKGWQYKDKDGTRGGVRKVRLEKGQLKIDAKGPAWSFVPAGPQGVVQVAVKIGPDWLCAEFGGEVKKDEAGRFEAKAAPAPASCVVGVPPPCEGEPFDSTFAAIQDVIFADYGCAEGFCHGSNDPPSGELGLLPDVAYDDLVGVDSVGVPGTLRVAPGDADASFLYDKLDAATNGGSPAAGQPMPLSGGAVTADELEAVRLWIEGGAPETGTVDGTGELLGVCLP